MAPTFGVRLGLDGIVVVPPFECAWLSGTGYELHDGSGCIVFEARAETDVTIILKPTGASIATKRLQPLQQGQQQQAPASPGMQTPSTTSGLAGQPEPNYTVIFGSHRNSCLKVEKNGSMVSQVQGVPGARVSEREFGKLWVDVNKGVITVGTGEPEAATISHQWVDPEPIPNMRHVGLSCWDRHVSFRCMSVQRACGFPIIAGPVHAGRSGAAGDGGTHVTPLLELCSQQLVASLGATSRTNACEVACVAELLLPTTRPLYRTCLDYLARHFREVTQATPANPTSAEQRTDTQAGYGTAGPAAIAPCPHPAAHGDREVAAHEFEALTPTLLCDVLGQNSIAVPEKEIFDVVLRWARARGSDTWAQRVPSSSQQPPASNGGDPQSSGQLVSSSSQFELDELGHASSTATSLQQPPLRQDSGTSNDGAGAGPGGEGAKTCAFTEEALAVREEVGQVLGLIRYPLMPKEALHEVLRVPLVNAYPAVQALVLEALGLAPPDSASGGIAEGTQGADTSRPAGDEHAPSTSSAGAPQRQGSGAAGVFVVAGKRMVHRNSVDGVISNAARFTRRSLPLCAECAYVCDGDTNGVLRFIGTSYGTQEWVNPVLARRVAVRASSPASRFTDPKALCGDKFLRTNFAGPRYVNGSPDTWWLVELAPGHSLMPTYYTLRHDASPEYPRAWSLQGSTDSTTWVDLRIHKADHSLKKPGQYASWPVLGPAAQVAYTSFRLLLTGPNASREQPHTFPLSYLELYGFLQHPPIAAQPQQPAPGVTEAGATGGAVTAATATAGAGG